MEAVSERNGVPVRDRRRVAGSNASRMPSPQLRASPPWWISSRITSVLAASVRLRCRTGLFATWAYVSATPRYSAPCRPSAFLKFGSIAMPTRAALSAHWRLRWSVGATTVSRCTTPESIRILATRSANVVLPAPGVATVRKSCGAVWR